MTKTERTTLTCADRDAFDRHLEEQGTALLRRAACHAIGWMVKRRRHSLVSVDHLVGVIFDKVIKCLDGGCPVDDLEAFAWTVATRSISDDWRRIAREEVKVEAYSATTESAEWRSPERRVVARDLVVKLFQRLSPTDRGVLLEGMRTGSGLDAAQRQRLCRARQRARRILIDLTGEAGNCLSDFVRTAFFPVRTLRRFAPPWPSWA